MEVTVDDELNNLLHKQKSPICLGGYQIVFPTKITAFD